MDVNGESGGRVGGAREGSDEDIEEEEVGEGEGVSELTCMVEGVEVGELVDELSDGEEVGRAKAREDELGVSLVEVVDGRGSVDEDEDPVSVLSSGGAGMDHLCCSSLFFVFL